METSETFKELPMKHNTIQTPTFWGLVALTMLTNIRALVGFLTVDKWDDFVKTIWIRFLILIFTQADFY